MNGFLKRHSTRIIVIFVACVALVSSILVLLLPSGFLALNWTTSLPGLVFWVDTQSKPGLGDMAAFYPPQGHKLHQDLWFGKVIVGQAGDQLRYEHQEVFINKRSLGTVWPTTLSGSPLERTSPGVIPEQHFFMWTPHERSYDSRYKGIGFIHEDAIFGRIIRLL